MWGTWNELERREGDVEIKFSKNIKKKGGHSEYMPLIPIPALRRHKQLTVYELEANLVDKASSRITRAVI